MLIKLECNIKKILNCLTGAPGVSLKYNVLNWTWSLVVALAAILYVVNRQIKGMADVNCE